jgi:hypothetical protein
MFLRGRDMLWEPGWETAKGGAFYHGAPIAMIEFD